MKQLKEHMEKHSIFKKIKEKEELRFKQFEAAELVKRKIDEEEEAYRQK